MFSSLPLEKSSTTRTCAPRASSASTRFEPMKDAPPVTRTLLPFQIFASWRFGAGCVFDDSDEFIKLGYSSIFLGGLEGAVTHRSETNWIISESSDGRSDPGGIVGISDETAIVFADNAGGVSFLRRNHKDGPARRENRIEFTRNDDAAESAPNRDDVEVASGHDVWDLLPRTKWKEADCRRNAALIFHARAIRAIPYKDQLHAVAIK